jgi:hypothetical protein
MPKRVLLPAILIAWMLVSCQVKPSTPTDIGSTSAPAAQPTALATVSSTHTPASSPVPSPEPASTTSIPQGCTVVSPQPTPGPTEQSIFPPVSDKDWIQGPGTAHVTLLEYSDFQ